MADDLFYPRKNEVDADSALKIVKELFVVLKVSNIVKTNMILSL